MSAIKTSGRTESAPASGSVSGVRCPGDDTLIALVEHALDPARAASLAAHVDGCSACRATVGHLAAGDTGARSRAMISQVGRYRLDVQLGEGGMGVVWSAWDPMLERRVAIKLLHTDSDRASRTRLLREARALAKLQHPHVVAVHDVGEHDGEVFIATELVDGEPLDRWQHLRRDEAVIAIYVQAARGLAAAHAIGLIHRDVKPANILVARDGRARVGDFGLASGDDDGSRLTREGYVVGTPAYMAPEQRVGGPIDARADQFALCVSLAEALMGTRPTADVGTSMLRPIAPPLAAVLARGLALAPSARFADMTALADAIERAAVRRPARRGPLVVAAALAVGALGGVGISSLGHHPAAVAASAPPPAAASVQAVAPPPAQTQQAAVPTVSTIAPIPIDAGIAVKPQPQHVPVAKAIPKPTKPPVVVGVTPPGSGSGSGSGSGGAAINGMTIAPPDPATQMSPVLGKALSLASISDPGCVPLFAAFDAAGQPGVRSPLTEPQLRARCEMAAGRCQHGSDIYAAELAAQGLSQAAIASDVEEERKTSCSVDEGTPGERVARLYRQAGSARSVAKLQRLYGSARAVSAQLGSLSASQVQDFSAMIDLLEEGFARYAGHCPDALRAQQLASFDAEHMKEWHASAALKACLATAQGASPPVAPHGP